MIDTNLSTEAKKVLTYKQGYRCTECEKKYQFTENLESITPIKK